MNIFVLDSDPAVAASLMCDEHIRKMVIENAQILCSVIYRDMGIFSKKARVAKHNEVIERFKGFPRSTPYGIGYVHHICVKWVCESAKNWEWTVELGLCMNAEWKKRWKTTHSSEAVHVWLKENPPRLPEGPMTPWVRAVNKDPYILSLPSTIEAYREFYCYYKHFATWKKLGNQPSWFTVKERSLITLA